MRVSWSRNDTKPLASRPARGFVGANWPVPDPGSEHLRQVISRNYDVLFEFASRLCGAGIAGSKVLPAAGRRGRACYSRAM
jgi:hypothetical protein